MLGETPNLLRLVTLVLQSDSVKAGYELLTSVLASPLTVGPAAGPVPQDVVQAVFAIEQDTWAAFPDRYAVLLFSLAVALADSPDAETYADPIVQRVLEVLGGFANDGKVSRRLVGLVAFLIYRWTPTNQAVVAGLANICSQFFAERLSTLRTTLESVLEFYAAAMALGEATSTLKNSFFEVFDILSINVPFVLSCLIKFIIIE